MRCSVKTQKGSTPCIRTATTGEYCWQHAKGIPVAPADSSGCADHNVVIDLGVDTLVNGVEKPNDINDIQSLLMDCTVNLVKVTKKTAKSVSLHFRDTLENVKEALAKIPSYEEFIDEKDREIIINFYPEDALTSPMFKRPQLT